jgi:hypothetical protein
VAAAREFLSAPRLFCLLILLSTPLLCFGYTVFSRQLTPLKSLPAMTNDQIQYNFPFRAGRLAERRENSDPHSARYILYVCHIRVDEIFWCKIGCNVAAIALLKT